MFFAQVYFAFGFWQFSFGLISLQNITFPFQKSLFWQKRSE